MDSSARFFTKLRNLAVNLETETTSLQQAHQNYDDEDHSTEGAVGVLQELHSEVRGLKCQVKEQLVRQRAGENDLRSFIKMCMVLKQRTTEDIQRLMRHYEKYGYRAPKSTQKQSESNGQEAEASEKEDEGETEGGEEDQEEGEGYLTSVTPLKMPPPPFIDPLRTPQLSDFGLSEIHLKRVLGGTVFSSAEAPMPMMTLPLPSLVLAMQPPMPKTPKCTLRMDEDDDLLTPRMVDFGLTEHTVCLNNDFTMDLQRKKPTKPLSSAVSLGLGAMSQRPAHVLSTPPSNSMMYSLATMESPEPPVFCTPGLKITKSQRHALSPPLQGEIDPESPCHLGNHQATPEVPAFETPYINRLLSTRKGERNTQADQDQDHSELPTSNRGSSQAWSYNVSEISIIGCTEEKLTPEMPSLESFLGSSLPYRGSGGTSGEQTMGSGEPPLSFLDQDGPTQTFNLRTPRVRGDYPEPSTPEMPDLSSVTQDIFKLISQSKKLPTAVVQPHLKPSTLHTATGKENRAQSLAVVSEREFLSLPSYLRQIPLSSLNQAIQKINGAKEERGHSGDAGPAWFLMEELKRITGVGTKAPMYFLCLTELKRLEHVQGVGTSAMYKVLSKTRT
ncbi:spindle and kinetochore-associated protein 3 isoform X1 [Oncorhynchus nerka]|uniref:spindle and kinetochore-associated protein 3 isoform X1 n=1 Tax=Oncorhynchus nerka TaxID=8023 RepID=UPI0011306891|nr:spindle and kinetochore-associated protein 3 [Oncorhynchus nerka]